MEKHIAIFLLTGVLALIVAALYVAFPPFAFSFMVYWLALLVIVYAGEFILDGID